MKTVSLSGSPRENVGKKDARKNRRLGKVPCVMYGGKEQLHFVVDEKPLKKIVFTPEVYIITLNVDGKVYETILQDTQYHPVTDNFLHVDFLELIPRQTSYHCCAGKSRRNTHRCAQGWKIYRQNA